MKTFLALACTLFPYLAAAFIQWEHNPGMWSENVRMSVVIFTPAGLFAGLSAYFHLEKRGGE